MRHGTRAWTAGVAAALSLSCAVLAGGGCVDAEPEPEEADISWEAFVEASTQHVEIGSEALDLYMVEGDRPLTLTELRAYYDELVAVSKDGEVEQKSTVHHDGARNDTWIGGEARNLTYCVSNDFGSGKARAVREMAEAETAWELAADVRFVYAPGHDGNCNNSNGNVVFSVRPWNSDGPWACAFYGRSDGGACVPRTLVIDYPKIDAGSITGPNVRGVGVLRHELGHVLGLQHEHARRPSTPCFEGASWSAVTDYDQRSVMHYPDCAGNLVTDLSLTTLDKQGVRKLYGAPSVLTDHRYRRIDFDGDRREDVALSGPQFWGAVPVAFSSGTGSFNITNFAITDLATWATSAGVEILPGDYNGDGATDLALTGPFFWGSVPVALSNRNGSFTVTNYAITDFAAWSATDNARAVTGDFNGDGRTDIALTGASGWSSVPVAFSNGDGSFTVANHFISEFAGWATWPNAKVVVGDYNWDGRLDLALTGPAGWGSIPIAFSKGDGRFDVTNYPITNFATWAATPDVEIVAGDFTGDGRTDLALTGPAGWGSIPVARSNGNGSFTVTNNGVGDFAGWAASAGAEPLVGDFNGDGMTDVALTGPSGWGSMPVAFSTGFGAFRVTNAAISDFAGWAASGAKPLVGDFDNDGRSDVALTGPPTWGSIPVARSLGNGQFTVTNPPVGAFADWASQGGVWIFD